MGGGVGSYRLTRFVIWLCSALTVVVGLFALEQAFVPTAVYPGGFYQSCGSPVFFDRHKVTESMTDGDPSPPAIVDECAQDAEDHVVRAVGATIVSASLVFLRRHEVKRLHRQRAFQGENAVEPDPA